MADKGSNCQKVWSNTKSTSSKCHSRAAKLSAVYAYSACLLASKKVGLVRTVLSAYLGFCGPAYSPTRLSFCGPSANCIALLRPTSDHSRCLTLWRAPRVRAHTTNHPTRGTEWPRYQKSTASSPWWPWASQRSHSARGKCYGATLPERDAHRVYFRFKDPFEVDTRSLATLA